MDTGGATAERPRPIRVFVVDDHAFIRLGLRVRLEQESDFEPVGEASTLRRAVADIPSAEPDAVIVDIGLHDGDGLELVEWIRTNAPATRSIVLSGIDDEVALHRAIVAGAAAYVLKGEDPDELLDVVRRVARGETFADSMLHRYVERRSERAARQNGDLSLLTRQEHAVLGLLGDGLTNREIAERLFVAEKTVRNHVSHILRKLNLRHRTEAALFVSSRAAR